MSKVIAVIGAMFGDEGKGLMTDYFTSKATKPTAVIRYNGSAQAGHTVQLPDGTRHIFSHFGSGTFNNCPTLLSEFFVVHPMLFAKELAELNALGHTPDVFVHPECSVTTPYDMIVNQIIENRRGEHRHGSVGVGFGETFEREAYMPLKVKELNGGNTKELREKLILIRDRWVPSRIQEAQNDDEQQIYEALNSDELLDDFMDKCYTMAANMKILQYHQFTGWDLVFEGAQGLLLDQVHGFFPHVTRSNTGLKNIIKILENFDVEELKVVHVSRVYTTRHGAGPLAHEQSFPEHIVDNTNHSHVFQGSLRYSPLNIDLLLDVVQKDLNETTHLTYDVVSKVAFTCIDQLADQCQIILEGELHDITKQDIEDCVNTSGHYASYGPTRDDVIELNN